MASNNIQISVLADVKDISRGIQQVNGQLDGMGQSVGKVTGFVKNLVTGFLALQAVKAVTGYIGDAIGPASDLNETVSKTGQIFGDSASGILEWSKNAAASMGQSRQQALDGAATFAVFGKSAGLAGNDLNQFAIQNSQLASDLASFHNTSPEQAINAIGAALRGESEPMRAYGVLLDDASMRQKALELGLISTTKNALTPQQKVLAAQALIMQQTGDAQGDFARTSDGLANKQRILSAKFEDVKTVVGSALLPIMTGLAGIFLDKVVPAAQSAAQWFGDNLVPKLKELWSTVQSNVLPILKNLGEFFTGTIVPALQDIAGFVRDNSTLFGSLAVAVGTLYAAFVIYNTAMSIWSALTKGYAAVQAAFNLVMAINPFVLIIAGLAALVAALIYAWTHSETFRNVVTAVWDAIWGFIKGVLNWFTDTLWPGIQKVWDAIGDGIEALKQWFIDRWNAIVNFVQAVPGKITGFFSGIASFFSNLWNTVKTGVVNGWNAALDFIAGLPGKILGVFADAGSWLLDVGGDLLRGLWERNPERSQLAKEQDSWLLRQLGPRLGQGRIRYQVTVKDVCRIR